jgi:hypothetical protein
VRIVLDASAMAALSALAASADRAWSGLELGIEIRVIR